MLQVSDDPAVESEYRDARAQFEAGRLEEARVALEKFVVSHAQDPLAKTATLLLVKIALAQGQPKAARDIATSLMSGEDSVAMQARYYDALALHALGQYAEAFELLVPLAGRLPDPAEADALVSHLVSAASAMGKPAMALSTLDRLLRYAQQQNEQEALEAHVQQCLQEVSHAAELQPILADFDRGSPILALVTARYARLSIDEDMPEQARQALDRAVGAGLGQRFEIARLLEELVSRTQVDMKTVGCILPMSGRSKLVAQQALRGVMLGAERTRFGEEGEHLSVIIRDDAGDPQKARDAVRNLVEQENVAAIIGPLDWAAAKAAAEEAELLGVPLLTLSSRESQTATTTVLRPFTSHRAEVHALLERAARSDTRRIVLLVPDSDYGKLVTSLAVQESRAFGLEEPVAVTYPSDATSFAVEARKVASLDPEAVLLADAAGKIALLAPALASVGLWTATDPSAVPDGALPVQILVTSPGWSADLVRRAGRYLQGAIFAAYFEPWFSDASQAFAALFADEYAATPNYIAALGHDAAVLVGAALSSAPRTRRALRDWLISTAPSRASALPLATPFGGFDAETGEPLAVPVLLRLEGSGAVVAP